MESTDCSSGLCPSDFADIDLVGFNNDSVDLDRFAFVEDDLWIEITKTPISPALRTKIRYVYDISL